MSEGSNGCFAKLTEATARNRSRLCISLLLNPRQLPSHLRGEAGNLPTEMKLNRKNKAPGRCWARGFGEIKQVFSAQVDCSNFQQRAQQARHLPLAETHNGSVQLTQHLFDDSKIRRASHRTYALP